MIEKIKMKSIVFTTLISVFFTGCSFSTKAVGINNNLNMQHIDGMDNLGLQYSVSMSYIGQVELNDKNVQIINKSIDELYQSLKQIDTYSAKGYEILVDKCGAYKDARKPGGANRVGASAFDTFVLMERECRRIYMQGGGDAIQTETRVNRKGFSVEKVGYPNHYSLRLKNQGSGQMYETNKPLPTGITHTIKMTDYDVSFDFWQGKAPFQSHISFIPIDSKLNIFINFTNLKSPNTLIKFTPNIDELKNKMVDIKNEFYKILEKNGLKIDETKEVSFSDFDLSNYSRGVHKLLQ